MKNMIFLRMLKNKYFYVFLVIFLVIYNYFFSWQVFSLFNLWSWTSNQNIKLWNDYIKTSVYPDTVIWVTLAWMKVWKNEVSNNFYIKKSLEYINSAELFIEIDVLDLLESWPNKATLLESHINQLSLTINEIKDIIPDIKNLQLEKNQEMMSCDSQKSTYDSMIVRWLNYNESVEMMEWINWSLNSWDCYIKNRIMANVYLYLLDKLEYNLELLELKFNILDSNTEMIIQNLNLFKNTFLEDLVELRDGLREYSVEE